MRSELVYSAALRMENRFLLAATVMSAVRKLHISSTRVEDTTNRILVDVARGPNIAPPSEAGLLPPIAQAIRLTPAA